jgi:signal transduction histidine kinase
MRKVYINKFSEELATQLGAAVAGRGIDFEVEALYDGIAWFDEQKLMRVFHNLTSNAIEAMPEGGRLRVKIEREADELVWTVKDTGPGIPAAVHARMFELFATGRKGGTGLGLAIVKRIIDDHHGVIRCDTGPTGTTFTIRMPATRSRPNTDAD